MKSRTKSLDVMCGVCFCNAASIIDGTNRDFCSYGPYGEKRRSVTIGRFSVIAVFWQNNVAAAFETP